MNMIDQVSPGQRRRSQRDPDKVPEPVMDCHPSRDHHPPGCKRRCRQPRRQEKAGSAKEQRSSTFLAHLSVHTDDHVAHPAYGVRHRPWIADRRVKYAGRHQFHGSHDKNRRTGINKRKLTSTSSVVAPSVSPVMPPKKWWQKMVANRLNTPAINKAADARTAPKDQTVRNTIRTVAPKTCFPERCARNGAAKPPSALA